LISLGGIEQIAVRLFPFALEGGFEFRSGGLAPIYRDKRSP
jgi:hypothetical protein